MIARAEDESVECSERQFAQLIRLLERYRRQIRLAEDFDWDDEDEDA